MSGILDLAVPGFGIPSLAEKNKHNCVYRKHNDNLRRDWYNFRSILTTSPAAFRNIKKIKKKYLVTDEKNEIKNLESFLSVENFQTEITDLHHMLGCFFF